MVSEQGVSSRKVVIDAGAAIKLQRLERFGGELFTTSGVYSEIKDENARALLATLPQELRVREPTSKDILFTKQFAKATGDLGFLSQNDIELIALTVALHREEGGSVKDKPALVKSSEGGVAFDWVPAPVAKRDPATSEGAGYPVKDEAKEAVPTSTGIPAEDFVQAKDEVQPRTFDRSAMKTVESGLSFAEMMRGAKAKGSTAPAKWTAAPVAAAAAPAATIAPASAAPPAAPAAPAAPTAPAAPAAAAAPAEVAAVAHFGEASNKASVAEILAAVEAVEVASEDPAVVETSTAARDTEEALDQEEDDEASDDGSSAGEWVTQDNMHRFGLGVEAAPEVRATCATADYSVQNVLLQMGITPLTFDGFAVRSVKLWGLNCRACFYFTRDTQKVFCPKCGHDTVVRVPIMVDQDGQATMLNSGRPLRTKGTIYSIPKQKGGRGWKPLYAEDEVLLGGRDRQLRHAENIQNKDKQLHDPFSPDVCINAWHQRTRGSTRPSEMPRLKAGLGRANPNANNYKHKTTKGK